MDLSSLFTGRLEDIKALQAGGELALRTDREDWLWSLGDEGEGRNTSHMNAFCSACMSGRLDTAQWLFGFGGVDTLVESEELMIAVCMWGYWDIAQWLVSLGNPWFRKEKVYMRYLRRKWRGTIRALALLARTYDDFLERYYAPGGKGFHVTLHDWKSTSRSLTTCTRTPRGPPPTGFAAEAAPPGAGATVP